MEKIASFQVNHDVLKPGMYVSRIDGDVVTYDIRMKIPNEGNYLSNAAMHTIEHLFATYVRNTPLADQVVYVGPMGCRTGFYLLLRDTVDRQTALALVREAFYFIARYEGEIPGAQSSAECGNYKEHDLADATAEAALMVFKLSVWSAEAMEYEQ